MAYGIPWVPEAFHARFQVSVMSYKMTRAKSFAARVFGLWPTKRSSPSHARKNLLYPGYLREGVALPTKNMTEKAIFFLGLEF